jgi:hypothetical protein
MQEARQLDESALRSFNERNFLQNSRLKGSFKLNYKAKKEDQIDDARKRAAELASTHWGLSTASSSSDNIKYSLSLKEHNNIEQSNSKMQNGGPYYAGGGPSHGHDSGSNGSQGGYHMQQIEHQFS